MESLLDHVIPFRFLTKPVKKALAKKGQRLELEALSWVYHRGDSDQDVYLIDEGQVEVVFSEAQEVNPENVIRSGHYFGEREAILQLDRLAGVRALTPLVLYKINTKDFLDLLAHNPLFAQAFGNILRDKHGIFRAFARFIDRVRQGESENTLNLGRLIPAYQDLDPALHPGALQEEIDWSALSYAIRRLPENLTQVMSWFLTDEVPASYRSYKGHFRSIPTPGRRREVWEMTPGKNMVLLRNGLSDLLDLVSCLCLYSVEARKIRHKLQRPDVMEALFHYLNENKPDGEKADEKGAPSLALPFSAEEWQKIRRIWPQETVQRMRELTFHHEDFYINLRRQWANYNSRRSEKWTVQLSKAAMTFLGKDPGDLGSDWGVHIISSNTHSITNLLHPFGVKNRDEILAWLENQQPQDAKAHWDNPMDQVYASLPAYLAAYPSQEPSAKENQEIGIYELEDTASTGIKVQFLCPHFNQDQLWDPDLPPYPQGKKTLIVNIDYAFGQQAEEILRNLILLFHRRLKSVNILGKAGALQGQRGDVLIPQAFIQQISDRNWSLDNTPLGCKESIEARLPGRTVHVGPLLTVVGTLLQNKSMLNYYHNIYGVTGLEMEGAYYHTQLRRFQEQGILPRNLPQRYFYYVSDLPLGHGPDLSKPMTPQEGIPPLYAISRQILETIFKP
jgi:CRP-like cAMP-binding protein